MIESAIVSGCCSVGCDALVAGVLPTPGVAYLAKKHDAAAGIVISASHNPYYDNGIKIFDRNGYKLSDETEKLIETLILDDAVNEKDRLTNCETGQKSDLDDGENKYTDFLMKTVSESCRFDDFTVVLDCANGATYKIAPKLFAGLGASVEALHTQPDGKNINHNCGSQHPESLANRVCELNARIGLAFDGDGDRLVAVDENGEILTGDQILAICALHLKKNGTLQNNTVVSTVMSNMGLGEALKKMNIRHEITNVGDRYVMEKMVDVGAVLGGEESGHTVFLNHQTTGDGILSALKLLEIMVSENRPLSELKTVMTVFPQVLVNVNVKQKPSLETLPEVQAVILQVEKELAGMGRVLVRYSGTQAQCRVMVEGPNAVGTENMCNSIAQVIKKSIGE
jgi:phosphoglucosamine mutase